MAKYKLQYAPEALEEINEAFEYYNSISKKLGVRFKTNLFAEMKAIKERPLSRSFRYDEVRFAVLKKFPYAAHYTVDESKKIIKIHAVLAFAKDDKTNRLKRF
jgi:plasmid stabilization system protein ParE